MSLAETITLDNADGVDVVFKRTRNTADGATYIDQSTTLVNPYALSVKHSVAGKGSEMVDRHLFQLQRTVINSSGQTRNITVNLTMAVPRDTAVTTTMIHDMVNNLIDFMSDGVLNALATTANIDALLRGEA